MKHIIKGQTLDDVIQIHFTWAGKVWIIESKTDKVTSS